MTTATNYTLNISKEYGGRLAFLRFRFVVKSSWVASIFLYLFPVVALRFAAEAILKLISPYYYNSAMTEESVMAYILILVIMLPFVIMPIRKSLIGKYAYDKIYMVSYSRDKVLRRCEKLAE